jgi:hypothetical protein
MPLDIASFIDFAGTNGMKLDAVSWHENNFDSFSGDWGSSSAPWNVVDHIDRVRQLIAQHPGVGTPAILINEYGTPQTYLLPSWEVGMFALAERTGIAGANRSCWTDCGLPGLDGLVAFNGTNWTGTLPAYWAAKAYGEMSGGTRVQTNSTATWRLDGLAVRQDSSSTIRVLIGQHWGCVQQANPACQTGGGHPAASTRVTVDWPYLTPAASVTINQIAAGPTPTAGPTTTTQRATITQGKLTVTIPGVADGDAYSITATASL